MQLNIIVACINNGVNSAARVYTPFCVSNKNQLDTQDPTPLAVHPFPSSFKNEGRRSKGQRSGHLTLRLGPSRWIFHVVREFHLNSHRCIFNRFHNVIQRGNIVNIPVGLSLMPYREIAAMLSLWKVGKTQLYKLSYAFLSFDVKYTSVRNLLGKNILCICKCSYL